MSEWIAVVRLRVDAESRSEAIETADRLLIGLDNDVEEVYLIETSKPIKEGD
jgi:hypothetical protein